MEGVQPPVVVDTRGLFCPVPIIKTSEAIRTIMSGGRIELISDDPAIRFDLPAWCRSMGHTIESERKDGSDYYYIVRKK